MAFAPVKGERPEWVVQKLTELGIDRIVPLLQRAQRRALERGARQDGGGAVAPGGARGGGPVPAGLAARRQRHRAASPTCTGSARAGEVVLAQLSGDRPTVSQHVVAVGPEGGWSTSELASGLPTVGFGLSVLRAETAAVTAGALLASLRTGTVAAVDGSGSEDRPQ